MLIRACIPCGATASSLPYGLTIAQLSLTSCHTTEARHGTRCLRTCRRYATATGSHEEHNKHTWPAAPKGHSCPTPYQILSTTRAEVYSKAEFYRLVKLYHPDRGSLGHLQPTIPAPIRLERYRLIVAAHALLSDPGKRSAYDRLGVGWHGKSELTTANGYRPFDHNWQDSVWANATWEDWEKWHARQAARERGEDVAQEPVYMSNSAFLAVVLAIICCGSMMNFGRAQTTGQFIMEQRDAMHSGASKELRRVRREKGVMDERDQRVDWFVRHRDATLGIASGEVQELRDNVADRMLAPNREVCRSEDVATEELG